MFNTINQTHKLNAVSGTLVKKYNKSFFVKTYDSRSENRLFNQNPVYPRVTEDGYSEYSIKKKIVDWPIVVIQAMLLQNGAFIAEIMWKEDYEELFKENEQ